MGLTRCDKTEVFYIYFCITQLRSFQILFEHVINTVNTSIFNYWLHIKNEDHFVFTYAKFSGASVVPADITLSEKEKVLVRKLHQLKTASV